MRKVKLPAEKDLPKGTRTLLGCFISTKRRKFVVTLEDFIEDENGQRQLYDAEIPKKYIKRESPLQEYEKFPIYIIPRENRKPILRGYQIILPRLSKNEKEEIRKKAYEELKNFKELPELEPILKKLDEDY